MDRVTGDQWFNAARTAVTAFGVLALGGAAYLAYRKQQSTEVERHDAILRDLHNRYETGAAQLDHEKPYIRLAGVYALAALADDWARAGDARQRQVAVDLLTSYFRVSQANFFSGDETKEFDMQEEEIWLSIFRLVMNRVCLSPKDPQSWAECKITLAGVALPGFFAPGGSLIRCNLSGSDIPEANFSHAILVGSNLAGANLTDANLSNADLRRVDFIGANLSGASLVGADLTGAYLQSTRYNSQTEWPSGYFPPDDAINVDINPEPEPEKSSAEQNLTPDPAALSQARNQVAPIDSLSGYVLATAVRILNKLLPFG